MSKSYGRGQIKIVAPVRCPKCNTPFEETESSVYICSNCGYEEPTEFGIVRAYLEEHGNSTAIEIARDTGISISKINSFLRNGRLEIPDGSAVFIQCKRCGIEIRYGKYCPGCAQELTRELKGAFDQSVVGEVPKSVSGKMQFLNRSRDK